MSTMDALVKINASVGAQLQKTPMPEYGPSDVLVKIRAAALCGTDLHIYDWNPWAQGAGLELPVIMGHECCGDVVAVGTAVADVKVGDKVAAETHVPCGKCYQCKNGEQHICSNLKLFGIHMNGCFAEYASIPAVCARVIPQEISYEFGSVMEPLGTAVRAAHEMRVGGANVVVLGCGPIGLFAVAAAKAMGAATIIATDISVPRLDIARTMGADVVINPIKEDTVQKILNLTNGYGTDVIIEASGSVDALRQSFRYLRKGGRVALIGLPGKPIELELGKDVVFKEAQIIGIHGRKMFETWTQMENLLAGGKLNIAPALTHVLPLARWEEGVVLAKNGQACKVIYRP